MDPLHEAAIEGNLDLVKWLIEQDPQGVNKVDGSGNTTLIYACCSESVETVSYLLENGAHNQVNTPGEGGNTPLHNACDSGEITVVQLLLSYGADATSRNYKGWTPLITACCITHMDARMGLLPRRQLVIHYLMSQRVVVVSTINSRDKKGRTAIWYACDWGRREVVKMLIHGGANPLIADEEGVRPVDVTMDDICLGLVLVSSSNSSSSNSSSSGEN